MPTPPTDRPGTPRAAAAPREPQRNYTRSTPQPPWRRDQGPPAAPQGATSATARVLALVALGLAVSAGVVAGVVIASRSGQRRQARSTATVVRTVTAPARPPTAALPAGAPGTFTPVNVQRFGFATQIPAHWSVQTHTYGDRQRVTLTSPGGQMIVVDRTPRVPSPAQIDKGFRTVSLTRWRGSDLSGTLWRFAAAFCAPVCSDWIGASPHAGYAVLIYSTDPTLVREAKVVATRLHDDQ
jgi:hypothetical protein